MKPPKIIAIIPILFLVLLSCQQPAESSDDHSQDEEEMTGSKAPPAVTDSIVSIELSVKRFSASEVAGEITLIMTNHTGEEILTGEHYHIEKLAGGTWKRLPLDVAFDDIGYMLGRGQSQAFKIKLLLTEYNYQPGKYRIKKNYSVQTDDHQYDDYEVWAEFIVE